MKVLLGYLLAFLLDLRWLLLGMLAGALMTARYMGVGA